MAPKEIDYDAGVESEWLDIRPNDAEVDLVVVDWGMEPSRFKTANGKQREDVVLVCDVAGETLKWRLNIGARRALKDAGVKVGDHVRVNRDDDVIVDGRTSSRWRVEVA